MAYRQLILQRSQLQVLQNIAACSKNDEDLANFQLVCRKIAYNVTPDDSLVWKARFLSKYDHPIIRDPLEFKVAYKLRRLVLNAKNFVDFRDAKDNRLKIELEVIRDMVLGEDLLIPQTCCIH